MNTAVHPKLTLPHSMDIAKALATRPPLPDFVLPGLSTGTVGALVAPGATGKTLLLLQICVALAAGLPVLGGGLFCAEEPVQPGKVVLVVAEETAALMHARLHAAVGELLGRVRPDIFDQTGNSLVGLLEKNLHIYPLAGRYRMLLDGGDPTRDGLAVLNKLSADARLVAIDPLRQFHTGEENDSWVMTKLVQDLQALASGGERAVLVAHHTNKWSATAGQGDRAGASRGSGAFTDAVRWQLNLSGLDDELAAGYGIRGDEIRQHVRLDLAKSNYLPPQAPVVLRRGKGGAFSVVAALSASGAVKGSGARGGRRK